MEVERILHMNEGAGENSYANNSLFQRTIIKKVRPVIEENIRELNNALMPECLMIADMGCSSGPNSLLIVSEIINAIDDACKSLNQKTPKFGVFLNDLPSNDFNTMFNLLPRFYKKLEEEKGSDFGPCFISGTPRSFYGSVFPDNFLHFVHSSYSIHWLSQVPKGLINEKGVALNKGNIYITEKSPPEVQKVYYEQFEEDFTLFLRSRAREMINGGRMVLTLQGSIDSNNPANIFGFLGSTLYNMVQEGLIEEEKLDNFNLPYYVPTIEEVKQLVEAEGSFDINRLENFKVDWCIDTTEDLETQAVVIAKYVRAVTEPVLATAFGQEIMDALYLRFGTMVKERIARETCYHVNVLVSMTKLG